MATGKRDIDEMIAKITKAADARVARLKAKKAARAPKTVLLARARQIIIDIQREEYNGAAHNAGELVKELATDNGATDTERLNARIDGEVAE